MSFLSTPLGRRLLFFCLYLSEGAPIGYIWLALPTRLRAAGVPLEDITGLTALLVLPWTFKFAVAPAVDGLRTKAWGRRHFVIAAQLVMGGTILGTLGIDPVRDFGALTTILFVHACAAATQDVAIDALCISSTSPAERGRLNGWMQAGMLIGRAMMGGGALVLERVIGGRAVVFVLAGLTTFSVLLVLASRALEAPPSGPREERVREIVVNVRAALRERTTWLGIAFALVGGAAFKALEVVFGPFLVDRGYSKEEVGWFSAGPMIICMTLGAVVGGAIADRTSRPRFVGAGLVFFVVAIAGLAASDLSMGGSRGAHLTVLLALTAFAIGMFTAGSYAMFMDLTRPAIAATQFSAFMGATNGCESWSSWVMGKLATAHGYPIAMLVLCGASVIALPALVGIAKTRGAGATGTPRPGSARALTDVAE